MTAKIETPITMAYRLHRVPTSLCSDAVDQTAEDIRARDRQVIAWCEAMAAEADRDAAGFRKLAAKIDDAIKGGSSWPVTDAAEAQSSREAAIRCEGHALAWRGTAATLRSAS